MIDNKTQQNKDTILTYRYTAIYAYLDEDNKLKNKKELAQRIINVAKEYPNDHFALCHAAILCSRINDPGHKQELIYLNKALKINPNSVPALVRRAVIFFEQDDFVSALINLMQAKQFISSIKSDEEICHHFCKVSELTIEIERIEQEILKNQRLLVKLKKLKEFDIEDEFTQTIRKLGLESENHIQLIDYESYNELKKSYKELTQIVNHSHVTSNSIIELNSTIFKKANDIKENLMNRLKEDNFYSKDSLKILRIILNMEIIMTSVRLLISENQISQKLIIALEENELEKKEWKTKSSMPYNLSMIIGNYLKEPEVSLFKSDIEKEETKNIEEINEPNDLLAFTKQTNNFSRFALMLQLVLYTAEKYNKAEFFLKILYTQRNFFTIILKLNDEMPNFLSKSFDKKNQNILSINQMLLHELKQELKVSNKSHLSEFSGFKSETSFDTSLRFSIFRKSSFLEINEKDEKFDLDKVAKWLIEKMANFSSFELSMLREPLIDDKLEDKYYDKKINFISSNFKN